MNSVKVTVINSTSPSTLSKQFQLIDGELQKTTIAQMTAGHAQIVEFSTPSEFAELLKSLKHNQALTYGLPNVSPIHIVTKNKFQELGEPKDYLPRTKEYFSWAYNKSGIFMLDYDPAKDGKTKDYGEILKILYKVAPNLKQAAHIWWCSSSSHVLDGEGNDITGLKGQRLYFIVTDASDIPRAGKALIELLWSAGHGSFEVGAAGQLLDRSLFDASVWQTNRLDFASGAQCIAPLRQERGNPIVFDGDAVDLSTCIPELTEAQKAQALSNKTFAKAELAGEISFIKNQYIEEKALEISKNSSDEDVLEHARNIVKRALNQSVLGGNFPIILETQEAITVGEILDNPARFHGKLTLDPIEPEYLNYKVVGKIYIIGGRPCIHSFAHGGRTYRLIRQPREIELIKGMTHDAVIETLNVLRQLPEVYDFGGAMVLIDNGKTVQFDEAYLTHWLGGQVQYWHQNEKGVAVKDDPPPKVIRALLSMQNKRGLNLLDAVVTAPILRKDGSVIETLGYDAKSRIYIDLNESLRPIPKDLSIEQVSEALEILMYPFKDFAFCSHLDRSIILSALLTACLRPVLDTAPGFGFDAPVQGSGKSLLAACVGMLATGVAPTVWPHTSSRDDEEVRKRIFTALRSGERAIIWDNVTGTFDSASLASALTSPNFTDRVLGKSESLTVPNRAIFMMTGNNLCLAGDMPRRILLCRINPETETPFNRSFDLNPLEYVQNHRQKMVRAALIIVTSWLDSMEYICDGAATKGKMASFELWDSLIRQPVAWVNQCVAIGEYADPMDAVIKAQANDPEKEELSDLLIALREKFGDSPFLAKEVIAAFEFEENSISDALSLIGNGKCQSSPKSLGRVLTFRQDKIVNGLCLRPATELNNSCRWKVQAVQ